MPTAGTFLFKLATSATGVEAAAQDVGVAPLEETLLMLYTLPLVPAEVAVLTRIEGAALLHGNELGAAAEVPVGSGTASK